MKWILSNPLGHIGLPALLFWGTVWAPMCTGGSCVYENPNASSKPSPPLVSSAVVQATSIGIDDDGAVRIAFVIETTHEHGFPVREAHYVVLPTCGDAVVPEFPDPLTVFRDEAVLFVPEPDTARELQLPVMELHGHWVATQPSAAIVDGAYAAVVQAEGQLHVAFCASEGGDLAYGCWEPDAGWIGTWVVDAHGGVGRHPSIAVGPEGLVHIGYYDALHDAYRHAWGARGEWRWEDLELCPSFGPDADLAVGPDGTVHVCGFDAVRGTLLLLTDAEGVWEENVLLAGGGAGGYVSLAVDADGTLHVACTDDGRGAVLYGSNARGAWDWTQVFP